MYIAPPWEGLFSKLDCSITNDRVQHRTKRLRKALGDMFFGIDTTMPTVEIPTMQNRPSWGVLHTPSSSYRYYTVRAGKYVLCFCARSLLLILLQLKSVLSVTSSSRQSSVVGLGVSCARCVRDFRETERLRQKQTHTNVTRSIDQKGLA